MDNVNDSQHTRSELGEVMNDLQRGLNSASYLDMLIQDESESGSGSRSQILIQEIKGCFSRAMATLNNSTTQANNEFVNQLHLLYASSDQNISIPSNSRSSNGPRIGAISQEKILLENPDDCYGWRIYGQEEIENSKFPRIYYECAHKDELNCYATKTVWRLEEHQSLYEIVYAGQHICMQSPIQQDFQNSQLNINSSSSGSTSSDA